MSSMTAEQIVKIQLVELQLNKYDSGIKNAYYFASPENKKNTGPFSRFKLMVKNDQYKHLINHLGYTIDTNNTYYFNNKKNFTTKVFLRSKYDKKIHAYIFNLSRYNTFDTFSNKKLNNYYRTDSVLKVM